MKLARTAPVVGLAAAVASGILVALASPTATAASARTDYTCTVPTVGDRTFPMSYDIPLLPPSAPAGFPVPAGLLSSKATLTVPADVAGLLGMLNVDGGRTDDFATAFGSTAIPSPIVFDKATSQSDGTVVFSGAGKNAAFHTPEAGSYAVSMPRSFTLTPTSAGNALPVGITCSQAAPGTLATITLAKQSAVVTAKAPKSVKAGAPVKLPVTVANDYSGAGGDPVTGKVTVKEGKKTLGKATLKNGKAVLKLAKLKAGKHTLVLSYGGDGVTAAGKSKVKLTVR